MSEKSHVSLGQKMCLVTAKPFDSGEILLDKKLRKSLERNTITGWGISPEVQEKFDAGYISLVSIVLEKSIVKDEKILPQDAWRTGEVAYLRRSVTETILTDFPTELNWIFVDEQFIEKLKELEQNQQKA